MKLILCLVVALFTFTAEAKAASTQYHYEGNGFTDISVTGCCGLRLVADVLFSFDTTGVSGTFGTLGGDISNISFNVVDTLLPQAPVSFGSAPFICDDWACHRQNFTLKDGMITAWFFTNVDGTSDQLTGQFSYFQQNRGEDGNILYDTACGVGHPCGSRFYGQNSNLPGTWTVAPVPGPVVGGGLPSLLMAVAGS
jgi:hypothetical protein